MTALARNVTSVAEARPESTGASESFAADVAAGLTATPKRLSPKYFYDRVGSELFERITELPEYYPTRCETGILRDHARDIAGLLPAGAVLIGVGSGSRTQTRIVLREGTWPAPYVPAGLPAGIPRNGVL